MVLQFPLLEHGIAENHNRSSFPGCIHGNQKLGNILQIECDSITVYDATLLQGGGQSGTLAVEFAITDRPVKVIYGRLFWQRLHSLQKHLKCACKPGRDLRLDVAGIVFEPGACLVGCFGSRCFDCCIVYHLKPPQLDNRTLRKCFASPPSWGKKESGEWKPPRLPCPTPCQGTAVPGNPALLDL